MNDWELFVTGQEKRVKLNHPFSELIVKTLGAKLPSFFKIKPPKKRTKRTKHIMDTLSQLGKKQGFKSMSHGISGPFTKKGYNKEGFKKSEWLYDLHWYEEKRGSHYQQTSLPLTVECEWDWLRKDDESGDNYSAIKWDFQKLLVANADLRVLIFKWRAKDSHKTKKKLYEYFTETIRGYRNLESGSKFLFVAFDNNGFWFSEKVKT